MSEGNQDQSNEKSTFKTIVLKIDEEVINEEESTSTFIDELWNTEESEYEEDFNRINNQKKKEESDENQKIINEDIEELADSSSNTFISQNIIKIDQQPKNKSKESINTIENNQSK